MEKETKKVVLCHVFFECCLVQRHFVRWNVLPYDFFFEYCLVTEQDSSGVVDPPGGKRDGLLLTEPEEHEAAVVSSSTPCNLLVSRSQIYISPPPLSPGRMVSFSALAFGGGREAAHQQPSIALAEILIRPPPSLLRISHSRHI